MKETHHERIARLQKELADSGTEWLWVEPSVSFLYLTGHEPLSIERPMGLCVPATGESRLVVPALLDAETGDIDAERFPWGDDEGPEASVASALKGVGSLHVQPSLPVGIAELLRGAGVTIAVSDPVASLRVRKDDDEIDALRRAGAAADDAAAWIATLDLAGVTERQLSGRLLARFLENGYPGWEPLVASGAGAAMPHYAGSDAPIASDVPVLVDFGCRVEGYWSDITRVYFPERVDTEISDAYEVVCAAHEAAFAAVGPGVACEDVDRAARAVIEEAGLGEYFIHRTGHGLGLEIHEEPYVRPNDRTPLEVGHVFTIEPGVYLPGRFGLRYENVIYLGPEGAESLNRAPRHLPLGTGA